MLDHMSGISSVNGNVNGSVVCYDYPLFMDLEGMSCEFYSGLSMRYIYAYLCYGVATISMLLKMIGLFCKRAL